MYFALLSSLPIEPIVGVARIRKGVIAAEVVTGLGVVVVSQVWMHIVHACYAIMSGGEEITTTTTTTTMLGTIGNTHTQVD